MATSTKYSSKSPYYTTDVTSNFLDVRTDRPIPRESDDKYYTITQTYNMRPDLLAYDLYGDGELWWVFAQRNPNALKDPVFDFVAGKRIFLPKLSTLKNALGF